MSGAPDVTVDIERSFKEVLYRFLEEVRCTKAALYLNDATDVSRLIVRYGFGRGDAPPDELPAEDPVVAAVRQVGTEPLVVNRMDDAPGLAQRLLAAGCQRMLLVPLLRGGRRIGFVDARDKAGGGAFDDSDRRAAMRIAVALVRVAAALGPAGEGGPEPGTEPADVPEALDQPLPWLDRRTDAALLDGPAAARLVESAAEAVVRDRVWAVAITVAEEEQAATLLVSAARIDGAESRAVLAHQATCLVADDAPAPPVDRWSLEGRPVPATTPPTRPTVIASNAALSNDGWSVVLSVVGAEGSTDPALVLQRLRRELDTLGELTVLRYARRSLARRLLEPGEARYPDLQHHSMAVAQLCWRLAGALGLDAAQTEDAVLAGLLHDVGMRELDYGRLYRLAAPVPEDLRLFRRHPLVGAQIVTGVGLDHVARAIRHHHERWDGGGYPDRLAGNEIPWLARLVHTAEVFDVLTSQSSYRAPVTVDRALTTFESESGRQFDPEMVRALIRVVP